MTVPSSPFQPDSDAMERLLRQTLSAEAAEVRPDPDALLSIQQRTAATSRPLHSSDRAATSHEGASRRSLAGGSSWAFGALGAAAATAAVITAVVVIGDQGTDPVGTPVAGPAQTTGQASNQVTMYYLGPADRNAPDTRRLYAETHTVPSSDDSPALRAVRELLTSKPLDPDYSSGWPPGVDVVSITSRNATPVITLKGAERFLTPDDGRLVIDDQLLSPVGALLLTAGVDDQAMLRTGAITVGPFSRPTDEEVRAWVSITSPVEGQSVDSPVTVTGSANVYEANVNWELLDDNGEVVDSGYTTAGSMEWKPFTINLGQLDPGTYTVRAFESSAENGRPTFIDDKTFTVR